MFPEEIPEIRKRMIEFYTENGYPRDRLCTNKQALLGATQELNRRCGSEFTMSEFGIAFMRLGKGGFLPRLGRKWVGPKYMPTGGLHVSV